MYVRACLLLFRHRLHWLTLNFDSFALVCLKQIQVYGACVANLSGGVDRFACDKEFRKLRECFQRVAKKKK